MEEGYRLQEWQGKYEWEKQNDSQVNEINLQLPSLMLDMNAGQYNGERERVHVRVNYEKNQNINFWIS